MREEAKVDYRKHAKDLIQRIIIKHESVILEELHKVVDQLAAAEKQRDDLLHDIQVQNSGARKGGWVMIDEETKRRIFGWSLICAILMSIGMVFGIAIHPEARVEKLVVSEMPKKLYCQPFSQPGNDYHRAKEGYKPVMWQELNKAFYNQSQGKGEVIGQTVLTCFEKLGSSQTVSADMYFYRSVK